MTNDNYKATDSSLADPPEPEGLARPRNVNLALGLIGGAVMIHLLANLRFLQESNFQIQNPTSIAVNFTGFFLVALACYQVARGRSWPRVLLLILTLVTFADFCSRLGFILRHMPEERYLLLSPYFLLVRALPLALNLVGLHLLYFSSGDWFRPRN